MTALVSKQNPAGKAGILVLASFRSSNPNLDPRVQATSVPAHQSNPQHMHLPESPSMLAYQSTTVTLLE